MDVQREWVQRVSKDFDENEPATLETPARPQTEPREPREERVWLKRGRSVMYKEAKLQLLTGELHVEGDAEKLQIAQVTPLDKDAAVLLKTASGTVRVRFSTYDAMRSWSADFSAILPHGPS